MNKKRQQKTRREKRKEHIEKERKILNGLLASGADRAQIYAQSLVVDRLIEKYLVVS